MELIRQAFSEALEEFEHMGKPAWSTIMYKEYTHTPFSQVSFLSRLYTRKVPSGGNVNTINVSFYSNA